jgi:hypothetical protein
MLMKPWRWPGITREQSSAAGASSRERASCVRKYIFKTPSSITTDPTSV